MSNVVEFTKLYREEVSPTKLLEMAESSVRECVYFQKLLDELVPGVDEGQEKVLKGKIWWRADLAREMMSLISELYEKNR